MSEENVEVVRRLYAAMNARDEAAYEVLGHPDGEFIPDPRMGMAVLRGRDDIVRFFLDMGSVFERLETEVERTWDLGDEVLCFIRIVGRSGAAGAEVDIRIAHLWTVRDGLVVRGRAFGNRDEALAAAGVSDRP